jgi:hypothetical protein
MKAHVTVSPKEVTLAINGQFTVLSIRDAVIMANEILDQVKAMLPPAIPR